MDDDLVRDAFARMTDSLEPPLDAGARVAARTTSLRRRRRALTGAAAASVAFLAIGGAAAATSLSVGGGSGTGPIAPAVSGTETPAPSPGADDDVRCDRVVADGDGALPVDDGGPSAVELLGTRVRATHAAVRALDGGGTLRIRLMTDDDQGLAEVELRRTDDGLELVEVRSCGS